MKHQFIQGINQVSFEDFGYLLRLISRMQNKEAPPLPPAGRALLTGIDDLVRSYYPAVVRLALSILDNGQGDTDWAADEAEDAAQETFIAAAQALDTFRGDSSPKTWLFSIAINQCRSRLRRRKAQRALAQSLLNVQRIFGGGDSVEKTVESGERDHELWAAVDKLDEKHRLPLILRYIHELPVGEIAQILNTNEGTVHSRLHYARQQLAQHLKHSAVFEEAAWR